MGVIGAALGLTPGSEIVTILIQVTLTPFVCSPMQRVVIVVSQTFPLFFFILIGGAKVIAIRCVIRIIIIVTIIVA